MDKLKRGFKKAKGKVKDLLRPSSRQSGVTTPARSPRSSQEPSATHDQGMSSTPSAIVLASQTAITSIAVDTLGTGVPAPEAPAPQSSPQPEHTSGAASTYAQPPSAMDDHDISTVPSAIVATNQTVIAPTAIAMHAADDPGRKAPGPKKLTQLERTRDGASAYAQPLSVTPRLDKVASVCNDLLTVVHGASDAFPPLKSALIEVLEIWNQCEVRRSLLQDLLLQFNCTFRLLRKLKMGWESSRASSRRS